MRTRTTVEIDNELLGKAMEYFGCRSKTAVIDLALRELIRSYGRRKLLEFSRSGQTLEIPGYEAGQEANRGREELIERLWNG